MNYFKLQHCNTNGHFLMIFHTQRTLKKNFTFILASENIRHFVEVGELHSNSRFTSLYVLLRFFTQKWSQKEEYKRKRKKIKKLYSISIPVTSAEIFHRFFTQQSFCCPVCYYRLFIPNEIYFLANFLVLFYLFTSTYHDIHL